MCKIKSWNLWKAGEAIDAITEDCVKWLKATEQACERTLSLDCFINGCFQEPSSLAFKST